jgi:tape measure domain-containing protein
MANPIIQAVYDLKDAISAKLKIINDGLRSNQKESDKTADASERSGKRMSDSYKRTADSIGQLRTVLAGIAAFVGFDKIKDGIEDVIKAGEDLDDLKKRFATAFGGIEQGAEAFDKVREFAKTVPQSFEDVSDAAIALRKAGFDPLDGSLQALIDNANATNQSQEELIATIDALGKANLKGAVNVKSLVTLTESGIPVFDLLGKTMGVSADRVRQLAETGQLGQDSIKQLVTALGQLRAGASADELGDFDSQLTKLKDSGREFLETIAKSGALDFFREQIKKLNEEVEEAAKSGKLQEIAKSISEGIVNGAKAIGGAAKFLLDHARAITVVAEAYAALKISGVALDLAKVSLGFVGTGKAATEAAKGTDKVAKSIKGIPGNVAIAIAVLGVEAAIATGEELAKLYLALNDSILKNGDLQRKVADDIQANAVHFAEVAASLAQYREQNVLSAAAVAKLSDTERDAYAERLAGLTKYLQAQVLYITNLDRAGLADKGQLDRLAQLKIQLDAAKKGQEALTQATQAVADAVTTKLSPAAQLLADHFEEIKNDSKAVGEEIQKTFDSLDLKGNISAVGDFATAFDHVASEGGKAADTLNATLLKALKDLSGEDLLQFQTGASFAIGQLGEGAEKTSAVLKATLEAALDKLGTKAEDTGEKITKSGADTIAAFNAVASNVQASAKTIEAAFESALAGVKTKDEAEALGESLQAAFSKGALGVKEFTTASRDLDERLRTLQAAVTPLASQFDLLGIKSQASLIAARDNAREAFDAIVQGAHDGAAAQEDVVRAFKAMVDAERAAVADSDSATKERVEDQLELKAAVLGLSDSFQRSGNAGKKAGDQIADGMNTARDAVDETSDKVRKLGEALGHESGDEFSARTQSWADSLAKTATAAASADSAIVLLTADQLRGLREIGEQLNAGGLTLEQYEDRIQEVMTGTSEAIQKQIEQLARLKATEQDLLDQIAQENGDDEASEDARHKKALQDIRDEATLDGALNVQEYNKLAKLEDELHALKLKNIKEQQKAQDTSASNSGGTSTGNDSGGNSAGTGNTTQRGTAAPGITVDFSGATIIGGTKEQIGEQLARLVLKPLQQIAARSV